MSGHRRGRVFSGERYAGLLEETESGFRFTYDEGFARDPTTSAVSLVMPKRLEPYESEHLFPFFSGLLAEGSTRALQERLLRLDHRDTMGLLLATGGETVGCVTVVPDEA